MTMKLSSLKVDLEREAKGDWIDYPNWPGVRFKVSGLSLTGYKVARAAVFRKLIKEYKKAEAIPDEIMYPEFGRVYCDHILHDWDGLDEAYTPELARATLTNPEFREVVKAVEYCAGVVGEVDAEFVEDAGKNSEPPSAGGSKDNAKTTGSAA